MLKKQEHFEKILTEAIYTEVSAKVAASKVNGCYVSISGLLKSLGVSFSGYRAFLVRKVSPTRQRKSAIKKQIQHIYDDSNQNYSAPKIIKELGKSGECIPQRTVGKYMCEMRIKAQWIIPWTTGGLVYLNCIIDLYSRKIIVCPLADTLEVSTVISTIDKAKASLDTDMPLIIHTNRGCQYVSEVWR